MDAATIKMKVSPAGCFDDPESEFAAYLDEIGFVQDPRLVALTQRENCSFPVI